MCIGVALTAFLFFLFLISVPIFLLGLVLVLLSGQLLWRKALAVLFPFVAWVGIAVGAWALAPREQPATFLIPEGFEGTIMLVKNEQCGLPPEYENGRRLYRVPASGLLITRDTVPNREHPYYQWPNKGYFQQPDNEYYLADRQGHRLRELPEVYAATDPNSNLPWRCTRPPVDSGATGTFEWLSRSLGRAGSGPPGSFANSASVLGRSCRMPTRWPSESATASVAAAATTSEGVAAGAAVVWSGWLASPRSKSGLRSNFMAEKKHLRGRLRLAAKRSKHGQQLAQARRRFGFAKRVGPRIPAPAIVAVKHAADGVACGAAVNDKRGRMPLPHDHCPAGAAAGCGVGHVALGIGAEVEPTRKIGAQGCTSRGKVMHQKIRAVCSFEGEPRR